MSGRTLAIGTSSPALSLALFEDGRLVAHDHRLIGRGHAEAVVPAVAALMGQERAATIIVDIGPGSFTGIRVGIAAARALGLAWGARVMGVGAAHLVAAAAFAARDGLEAVTVLLDAGRGQVIRAQVNRLFDDCQIETLAPERIVLDFVAQGGPVAGAGVLLLPDNARLDVVHAEQPDTAALFEAPAATRELAPAAIYVRPPDAGPALGLPL